MTQITESGGIQEIKRPEPPNYVDLSFQDYPKDAEKVNGRWAMLGFTALIGAYITTGQIIPSLF